MSVPSCTVFMALSGTTKRGIRMQIFPVFSRSPKKLINSWVYSKFSVVWIAWMFSFSKHFILIKVHSRGKTTIFLIGKSQREELQLQFPLYNQIHKGLWIIQTPSGINEPKTSHLIIHSMVQDIPLKVHSYSAGKEIRHVYKARRFVTVFTNVRQRNLPGPSSN